ncbi:Myb/SANT-like DNA-binding domain [Popillia japonica]|uniref:Regulatory protein zeste n=1 Tax=Popillia japonica TaxID=7064 RepID=A0AAW1JXJ9_POPJA
MSKRMKVKPTQWNIMLEFLEEHPQLITQKFDGINGREEYNKLWAELSNKLNAMGLGSKSVEKWQRSLVDWKQKVKSKAQALREEQQRTGGGDVQTPSLNDNELRLINLMGWTAIRGNGNIELGLTPTTTAATITNPKFVKLPKNHYPKNLVLTPISSTTPVISPTPITTIPKLNPLIISQESSSSNNNFSNPATNTSTPTRKRKNNENELEEMHSELMCTLRSINSNLGRLADSADVLIKDALRTNVHLKKY